MPKKFYFQIFLILLFLTYTINIVDIAYYLFGLNFSIYQKLVSITIFLLALFYAFFYGLKLTSITIFIFFYSIFSFLYGIYTNGLNFYFISHIYSILMPIFLVSFGINFKYHYEIYFNKFIKILKFSFFINIVFILIYILTHYLFNIWDYFGFATNLAYLVPLLFYKKQFNKFYISFFLDFFSGKRMTLLTSIALFIREKFNRINFFKFLIFMIFLTFISSFLYLRFQDSENLARISNVVNVVLSDERSLSIATSGRSDEVFNLLEKMNSNKVSYYIGSGFGASYLSYDYRGLTESEIKHYAHISPFYYIFIFGIPFTLIFYFLLFKLIFKNKSNDNSKELLFRGLFMSYFIMSFFGSILFVSPIFWFYLGTIIIKKY